MAMGDCMAIDVNSIKQRIRCHGLQIITSPTWATLQLVIASLEPASACQLAKANLVLFLGATKARV